MQPGGAVEALKDIEAGLRWGKNYLTLIHMMPDTQPLTSQDFLISDSAASRIGYLMQEEPEGSRLRIAVEGGGCSGFQYRFDFDHAPLADDDEVFTREDAQVVIDTTSLSLLEGSMIDYVEKLGASFFEITNPNSSASCGCGNSFSV